MTGIISCDAEDAAAVAEVLLSAGRPELIPRYLQSGLPPDAVQREMLLSQPPVTATPAASQPSDPIEDAAARFAAQCQPNATYLKLTAP
jgi:hypothetical protein